MLFTTHDPRQEWRSLMVDRALTPAEQARLAALPAGAREAPHGWVWTMREEQRARFDRDEQDYVTTRHTHVTGWRDTPDPRIERAGELSLHGVETVAPGLLAAFPTREWLGGGISALMLPGHLLESGDLTSIGRARAWADLSIWGSARRAPARATFFRELVESFPSLLGLELQGVSIARDDLFTLASAPATAELEDLTMTGCPLDPFGVTALASELGSLVHLDLRDAHVGAEGAAALAPKLKRARRIQLSHNPIGDAGLRALLAAGALEQVQDLWLSSCQLSDAGAHALAEAHLPALRGLFIDSNAMTDEGVAALIRAPFFAGLEGASLAQRGLGARSRTWLAGHPLEDSLRGTTRLPGVCALWFLGRVPAA